MATGDEQLPTVQVPGQFEAFYREEFPSVVALSYALGGSRHVAEDLAQEAFLRAHRDWERVGRMNAPGAWVRRVAANLARSRFRRLRAEARARVRLTSPEVSLEPPSAEHEAFWDEVRRLPTRQAQAVALRYIDDMPIGEIAEVLGVAGGTVKALLHQGRERLRRQLAAKGLVDDGAG